MTDREFWGMVAFFSTIVALTLAVDILLTPPDDTDE